MLSAAHEDDKTYVNILIVTNHLLLGEVLEALLIQEAYLRVHRLQPAHDQSMSQEIERLRPPVIIVDEELMTDELYNTIRQLGRNGRLHLIVLSPEHNDICLYRSHRYTLTGATELVTLIATFARQT